MTPEIEQRVTESRLAQGLPPRVEDPRALAIIVHLLTIPQANGPPKRAADSTDVTVTQSLTRRKEHPNDNPKRTP